MPSLSDSADGPSPPPSPTISFNSEDSELYKHLPPLVDGVTKGQITASTTLVALYDYEDEAIENTLLRNLTGIAKPAVPCQLLLATGSLLPPSTATRGHGYELELTYNKLLLAPTVRLQCDFFDKELPGPMPYLSLSVEWHFNHYSGAAHGIVNYNVDSDNVLSFNAGAATSSGFNRISHHETKFGSAEHEIVSHLKSFRKRSPRRELNFLIHDHMLSHAGKIELLKIRARLPGGAGVLLPSIGRTEYAPFGQEELKVHSKKDGMRKPKDLLSGAVKHPMVPLACTDTFSTIKEAGAQLAYSATIAEAESREALKMWAEKAHTPHRARLFAYGNFAILAVTFSKFDKLGSVNDEIHYRIPSDMRTKMIFQLPGNGKEVRAEGSLMSNNPGLPSHDALFLITSRFMSRLVYEEIGDPQLLLGQYFDVKFSPRCNSGTYSAQMDTIARLQRSESQRWHAILLNQAHDAIPEIDLTINNHIPAHTKAKADAWLRSWMAWNAEQLQVIEGIKRAKGGAIIVMGPAGTGKTLLQQALAIYFWMLGYHVLALAPANSNADHIARQMDVVQLRDQGLHDLRFCRLYPSSRDGGLEKLTEKQAVDMRMGQKDSEVLSFAELLVALEERRNRGSFSRAYGVVEIVIRMAEQHRFELNRRLRDESNRVFGDKVNAWDILREFIAAYKDGTFDPQEPDIVLRYRRAYQACKGHIIGISRFMITTTGNVRAADLLHYWTSHEYGVPCIGVMVFVDEAAKDLEVNVWGGVVCETWAELVKGVFMFGDDRQLKPTNTSAKEKIQFNAYSNRLDIALPCRLVREGFPCYRLREQRRMHTTIASFPNNKFYDGELRNGPGTSKVLDAVKPGLQCQLEMILGGQPYSNRRRQYFMGGAHENDVRLVWLEVNGRREMAPSRSMIVQAHVDVFFNWVFPKLHGYFKQSTENMEDNVMIICAYSATVYAYRDRIAAMLARDNTLTPADMPRVLTVDASQGEESFMVFFDGSYQNGDIVGFMSDPGRCNVAVTRAKEIFWMIGGSMQFRHTTSYCEPINHMTMYKRELDDVGKSHRFR